MLKSVSLLLCLLLALSSSCAYNKQFLRPTKYYPTTQFVVANKTKTDSVLVRYHGPPYQPVFLKNGRDTLAQEYTVESVLFRNRQGTNLNGWMLKPRRGAVITRTIVHFHGNAGSLLGQYSSIRRLAANDTQVFVFDYSGFGFSDGQATRANLLTDGIAAVDYVKTRADAKNTTLVLYGQSYGGHLAVCVATESQKDVDLLVVEGAFSNHKDLAALGANPFVAFASRLFVKELYSGTEQIKNMHKPVLIIHSTEDQVIPFVMGEQLFANAHEPKYFLRVKGPHLGATANNLDEVVAAMNRLLTQ